MSKQLVQFFAPERLLARCWVIIGFEAFDPESAFADIVELPEAMIHLAVAKNHQGLAERCKKEILVLDEMKMTPPRRRLTCSAGPRQPQAQDLHWHYTSACSTIDASIWQEKLWVLFLVSQLGRHGVKRASTGR